MGIEYAIPLNTVRRHIERAHGSARGLSSTEVALLDELAGEIVDAIADEWPVDTSTSRDAWTHQLTTTAGNVSIELINDTSYAEYVHRKGEVGEPLYETLLPAVVADLGPKINAQMRAAIDDTERRYQEYKKAGVKGAFNKAMSESARRGRKAA